LKENGYLIAFKNFNDSTKRTEQHYIDISKFVKYVKANEIQGVGLKTRK